MQPADAGVTLARNDLPNQNKNVRHCATTFWCFEGTDIILPGDEWFL